MTTIGFYFRGMERQAVNALRARLNDLAAGFGYIAHGGPTTGRGNAAELFVAIDGGEVALVLLSDEQRAMVTLFLEQQVDAQPGTALAEALQVIADALVAAAQRQAQADYADIQEWSA
jgi:hypothetical protein